MVNILQIHTIDTKLLQQLFCFRSKLHYKIVCQVKIGTHECNKMLLQLSLCIFIWWMVVLCCFNLKQLLQFFFFFLHLTFSFASIHQSIHTPYCGLKLLKMLWIKYIYFKQFIPYRLCVWHSYFCSWILLLLCNDCILFYS